MIRDIRPAAPFHFLVISKIHLRNLNSVSREASRYAPLTPSDFLQKMGEIGRMAVQQQANQTNFQEEELRIGFHKPPFNSVLHLHLHVIYPYREMNFIAKLFYGRGVPWFASLEDAKKYWI